MPFRQNTADLYRVAHRASRVQARCVHYFALMLRLNVYINKILVI